MEALQAYGSDSDSSESESSGIGPWKKQRLEENPGEELQDAQSYDGRSRQPYLSEVRGNDLIIQHASPSFASSQSTQLAERSKPSRQNFESSRDSLPRASALPTSSSFLPPPTELLNSFNSASSPRVPDAHGGRIRSFPHVEGNFALHVYLPVPLSSIAKRQLEPLMKKAASLAPELESMGIDLPSHPATDFRRRDMVHGLRLAEEYHISLSRTVPIRIHQIDSIVPMLRHKFANQKRYTGVGSTLPNGRCL